MSKAPYEPFYDPFYLRNWELCLAKNKQNSKVHAQLKVWNFYLGSGKIVCPFGVLLRLIGK